MGRVGTEDQPILRGGTYPRRTENRKCLGGSCRRGKTQRPAPDQTATKPSAKEADAGGIDYTNLMPLMNTAFAPGHCRETVEAMAAGPRRDIAMAEYHYFSGQPEAAAKEAEAYLTSPDMGARFSPV